MHYAETKKPNNSESWRWDVPPENAGQIVVVSYSDGPASTRTRTPACEGAAFKRVQDRSDNAVQYYRRVASDAQVQDDARLRRAAAHVDAVDLGDGRWAHYADETSSWWVVSSDELAELCDYLDDGELESPYSHWCAGTSATEMPSGWEPHA